MNQLKIANISKGLVRLGRSAAKPIIRPQSSNFRQCFFANNQHPQLSSNSHMLLRCCSSFKAPVMKNSRCFVTDSNTNSDKKEIDPFNIDGETFDDVPMTPEEKEKRRIGFLWSTIIGSLVGVIGLGYLLYLKSINVEAKSLDNVKEEMSKDQSQVTSVDSSVKTPHAKSSELEEEKAIHKSKAGFRERKIIEYENRIRAYSTPDKVFRYFATLQNNDTGIIYMTPEDFVRSLTPDTMQPEGLGLDEFKKFDKNSKRIKCMSKISGEDCVFNCLGEGGLISFSDYVFLLTVLGTPSRHIDIAFRMFDLNGDGEVSTEEFKRVKTIFLNMTSTGMRHRDRNTTGNVIVEEPQSGIMAFFFGADGQGKLTVENFVEFKRKLQRQVMRLEFESYKPEDGRITEVEFAEILLTYSSLTEKQRKKKIRQVKKAFSGEEKQGILFSDYLDFFSFLLNIRDVDMALSFHTVAGQAINPATFKQVALTVAGVNLRDHLIDVVFKLFDENDDGQLSNKEFVAVMKDKLFRGLNKPKDTGLTRFLSGIITCARQHIPDYWRDNNK